MSNNDSMGSFFCSYIPLDRKVQTHFAHSLFRLSSFSHTSALFYGHSLKSVLTSTPLFFEFMFARALN